MRLLLSAQDLQVGDEIVGQGKITSISRDPQEVDITGLSFRFTTAPEHEIWVDRPTYVPQPSRMGTFG